jgi:sporulation protein YunB
MRRFFFRDTLYIIKARYIKDKISNKKSPLKFIFIFFITITLVSWGFSFFDTKIKPTVATMAEAKAKAIAINTINKSINEKIVSQISYEDLIIIKKDSEDRVTALQTNTSKMNEMQAIISSDIQEKFAFIDTANLKIPLGNLFNSSILAGWGPRITIRIIPIGTVQSKFIDSFTSAGINQTKHKISLDVKGTINVILPLMSVSTEVTTNVPVVETIIVGNVPVTYIDVRGSNDDVERQKALDIGTNFSTNAVK